RRRLVNPSAAERLEGRLLVLALTAKDAELTRSVFESTGLPCDCFANIRELCDELDLGAGAVLIPEEAIIADKESCLLECVRRQLPWSDLPIIVMARPGADSAAIAQAMDLL